jgi:RNA polymerase sigma-70 factor (ECF subfamily)
MLAVSDEELAGRAGRGDERAFREVLERHYDRLYRIAYRFFGSAAEAEDVAQDIAMALAARIGSFRGDSRFSTWLYAVALNQCRDHARQAAGRLKTQGAFAAVSAQQHADWADSDQRTRWLYLALDRLEPQFKETALLVLAEDMSHAEAGTVLGIKESTVSWRMHEVKKKLKAMADHERRA